MIGIAISIFLVILGICQSNVYVGLADILLGVIWYIVATYHIRWEKTFNEVKNRGGQS